MLTTHRLSLLSLSLFLLLGLSLRVSAADLPLPLEAMPGKTLADVKDRAAAESTAGPVWGNAPDPKDLPVHQTFRGTVTADATMTKLAIFSDDGCDVYIDGMLVWSARDKPQALPDLPNSLHELPVTLTVGDHSVQIDYSNVIYTVADASKGIAPDIDGCTLFQYGPIPVVHVTTGSWQPNPAAVGQTISSDVTAQVSNPPAAPSGHHLSERWGWATGGVYQSSNGASGSFVACTEYAIGWTQGSPATKFSGIFQHPNRYIIKVTATVTYHDDNAGSDVGTYSGTGYIGGDATDLSSSSGSAPATAQTTHLAQTPRQANAPPAGGAAKGVPVTSVSVASVQYKDPSSGNFVPVSGTLYVLKDTKITFKAIPNPNTATFAAGQPTWSGTSGASGTGQTTDVQFGTVSTSATDYKTVVVTSDAAASDTNNSVKVVVTNLTLKQVSFSGSGSHVVKDDITGNDDSAPQWQDNSPVLNGTADDSGDKHYPLCYTRNTTASVAVVLVAVPSVPGGTTLITSGQVKIRGKRTNTNLPNYTLPATVAASDATGVSIAATPLSLPFPNTVACYIPPLGFQWDYSNDGGTTWRNAGLTDHKIYITLGVPATPNLYQTVLETGCIAAQGKTDVNDVVSAIANAFTPLNVKRVADGKTMQYWGPIASPPNPGIFTTGDLLHSADGRCGAWQNFFIDVLKAQNIPSQAILIEDKGPASVPAGLTFYPGGSALAVYQSIPAQGNPTPAYLFTDHAVVEVPTVPSLASYVYDPSYGKVYTSSTLSASQQAWEDTAVDYYLYAYTDNSSGRVITDSTPHPDIKGIRETVFSYTKPNS